MDNCSSRLSCQRPTFLTIPLEIRMQIYSNVSTNRFVDEVWRYNLTATCHQIRNEAFPLFLQNRRPWFRHDSLRKFLDWAKRGNMEHLGYIRSLSLTFLSKSCFEILRASSSDQMFAVTELRAAFENLANVEELVLLLHHASFDIPLKESLRLLPEKIMLIEMISTKFTKLSSYRIISDWMPLNYLQAFHNLRHLTFSGYSTSPPEEVLYVLTSLKHLESMRIDRPELWVASHKLSRRLVMTYAVISQLNPLKSFEMISTGGLMSWSMAAVRFDASIMNALLSHSSSLRDLRIIHEHTRPHPRTEEDVSRIMDFIATSEIKNIYISIDMGIQLMHLSDEYLRPWLSAESRVFDCSFVRSNPNSYPQLRVVKGKHPMGAELTDF